MPTHPITYTHTRTPRSSSLPLTRYTRLDRPAGTGMQSLREAKCCAQYFVPWSLLDTPALNIQISMLITPMPRSVSVARITANEAQARARPRCRSPPPNPTPTLSPSPASTPTVSRTQAQPQPQPSAEPQTLLPTLAGSAACARGWRPPRQGDRLARAPRAAGRPHAGAGAAQQQLAARRAAQLRRARGKRGTQLQPSPPATALSPVDAHAHARTHACARAARTRTRTHAHDCNSALLSYSTLTLLLPQLTLREDSPLTTSRPSPPPLSHFSSHLATSPTTPPYPTPSSSPRPLARHLSHLASPPHHLPPSPLSWARRSRPARCASTTPSCACATTSRSSRPSWTRHPLASPLSSARLSRAARCTSTIPTYTCATTSRSRRPSCSWTSILCLRLLPVSTLPPQASLTLQISDLSVFFFRVPYL